MKLFLRGILMRREVAMGWTLGLAILSIAPNTQAQNHNWSRAFGDTGSQRGHAVATDTWGNVVVAGECSGAIDFGCGLLNHPTTSANVFLVKFDANGQCLWSHSFGDSLGSQIASAVAVDPNDNIVIAGPFTGSIDFGGGALHTADPFFGADLFVAEFSADGEYLWSSQFGLEVTTNSIATDQGGDIFIGGALGDGGPFLAKVSSGGAILWAQGYGSGGITQGVALDSSGNVYLAGSFEQEIDLGGGTLQAAGPYGPDIFLAKLTSNGTHIWSKRFGDPNPDEVLDIAADSSGHLIVVGRYNGGLDLGGGPLPETEPYVKDPWLARFDPDGEHVWSQGFVGQVAHSRLAISGGGSIILAGDFFSTVDFGGGPLTCSGEFCYYEPDIFLAHFNLDGTHVWSQSYGDASEQVARDIAVDTMQNVVIAGDFRGTVDFGGGPLTWSGGYESDVYVASLRMPAVPVAIRHFEVSSHDDGVRIAWQLSQPATMELLGIDVQRASTLEGPFINLTATALIPQSSMTFIDRDVSTGRTYYYRLSLLQRNGNPNLGPVNRVVVGQIARDALTVSSSADLVKIRYSIGREKTPVRLVIYDVAGHLIRELEHTTRNPGDYALTWDLQDRTGERISRGVLIVDLNTGSARISKKFVIR